MVRVAEGVLDASVPDESSRLFPSPAMFRDAQDDQTVDRADDQV